MLAQGTMVLPTFAGGSLTSTTGASGSTGLVSPGAAAGQGTTPSGVGPANLSNGIFTPAGAAEAQGAAEPVPSRRSSLRDTPQDTEFQRFVLNATGVRLPLFGQRYFDDGNLRSFTPFERAPVPADYVLGPGDELNIRIWGSIDGDLRAIVDRNGQISIPRVGTIGVAGLKASEVEAHLHSQIARVFKNFSLNVTLGQLRSIQVFVVGQARHPGNHTVSSLSTLVNVIFSSGGPDANGSMRSVQLKRNGKIVAELDLYDFIVNGNKDQDQRLLPGDVIVYTAAGPRVAVLGSLDGPAIYELKTNGESINQLLTFGGGRRASTNTAVAQLERIDSVNPKAPRTVSSIDLSKASDTPLRDGDILTLFSVEPQFANAVTLRGNVARPLRYPYTPGMRISQLIPDREALITPDYYQRKNKLVQFVESRQTITQNKLESDLRTMVDEPNWEYAVVERLDSDRVTMKVIPFNLARAVIDHDPQYDLQLQAGDVVTIFGHRDIRNPVGRRTRLVRVEGEVAAPGIYQVGASETLRALLARTGGLTSEAYVFGLEFSREETRKAQERALDEAVQRLEAQLASSAAQQAANLSSTDAQSSAQLRAAQLEASRAQLNRLRNLKPNGRISLELDTNATRADELPDLPLEDGDRIAVPHKPGFVFTVGAVANTNGQLWRPGRQLKHYLDTAGVEPDADEDNIFVLRADGSVQHSSRRGWFGDIEKLELMPGDTVVVPDKTNRETFWSAMTRGLKDWSQILYQFGLSAAAIKTLRN